MGRIVEFTKSATDAPITKNQPRQSPGFAGYALPKVRIFDFAGDAQASGF
jgi:hypothetical protein